MTMNNVNGEAPNPALVDAIAKYRDRIAGIKAEVGRVFIGKSEVVESLLVALFSGGHVLLEGVPGVAKTTLVRAFAETISGSFRRIQFTPDLLPSDISGVYIPNLQSGEFVLRKGPVFANVVIGDEINRAPAKTQAGLLEAMQERQVTIEGTTHALPNPFLVLATQNPIEQEGVYELPEAQLDRFLLKIVIGYPAAEEEYRVLQTHHISRADLTPILTSDDVNTIQQMAEAVFVSDELVRYIVSLARFTREHPQILLGASPRAALSLLKAVKARAIIFDRAFVLPDDVKKLAAGVFSHRMKLTPEAEFSAISTNDIVSQALNRIPYSGS